ncbi:MAG: hypothetical protein HIU57_02425 [Acidobacteria bacterium]|nr:hypothetical protein [Acidobacteriota bacterium]
MRVRLWRHQLSLGSPITTAVQVHATRAHLFLEVEIDGVRGLGEISPQPYELNGDPGCDDVVVELEHFTLRQFFEATLREGHAPHWSRVTHFAGSRRASHPAAALLEMALLDAHLRARHETIEEWWPARFDTPIQSTVSLMDEQAMAPHPRATQLRAKVSRAPVPPSRWRELAQWGLPVLLDFNGVARDVEEVLSLTASARPHVEVIAVEQPFAPGNVVEHARLATRSPVPVSLDEGVRHRRDLDQIVRYHAAELICVKPARVGGFAQARTMIEQAQRAGLGVYLGGFFESPLARRANRALARHYLERPSDVAEVDLDVGGLLSTDPWGCGYLPGVVLEAEEALVNRHA